jgi:hypothetical protein
MYTYYPTTAVDGCQVHAYPQSNQNWNSIGLRAPAPSNGPTVPVPSIYPKIPQLSPSAPPADPTSVQSDFYTQQQVNEYVHGIFLQVYDLVADVKRLPDLDDQLVSRLEKFEKRAEEGILVRILRVAIKVIDSVDKVAYFAIGPAFVTSGLSLIVLPVPVSLLMVGVNVGMIGYLVLIGLACKIAKFALNVIKDGCETLAFRSLINQKEPQLSRRLNSWVQFKPLPQAATALRTAYQKIQHRVSFPQLLNQSQSFQEIKNACDKIDQFETMSKALRKHVKEHPFSVLSRSIRI